MNFASNHFDLERTWRRLFQKHAYVASTTNFYGNKTRNLLYSRLAHSLVNTWRTRRWNEKICSCHI